MAMSDSELLSNLTAAEYEAMLGSRNGIVGFDKITCKAFMTILGGWCILLIIGAQLAWGNQSTYIASYFYMLGHDVRME